MSHQLSPWSPTSSPRPQSVYEYIYACGRPEDEAPALAGVKCGLWREAEKWGSSGLSEAAQCGSLKVVTELIKAGAHVEEVDDLDGLTPLLWACSGDQLDCMRALLDAGASKAHLDLKGRDAMMVAALKGAVRCVDELLSRGHDPNVVSPSGLSAFVYACTHDHPDVVEQLLKAGVPLEHRKTRAPQRLEDCLKDKPHLAQLVAEERARREALDLNLTTGGPQRASPGRGGTL